MKTNSLDKIQEGDYVSVFVNYDLSSIEKVLKTSKTLINTKSARFKRSGGRYGRNSAWHFYEIKQVTQEHVDELKKKKLVWFLNEYRFDTQSLDVLEAVSQLITEEG